MYKIWGDEFGEERGYDICEEDDGFGNIGTNKVECGGEDDNVGDIVDEAYPKY